MPKIITNTSEGLNALIASSEYKMIFNLHKETRIIC
jgi:hypothetical protein